MATGPQLVHKQFNSPIGLYSRQNIEETLNKHLHHLDNGATGIDFNDPSTGKAGNLANSAVLRMLEEEERTRRGYPNQKKVVWPPAPETNGYPQQQQQQQQQAPAYYNKQPQQQQQQSPQYQSQPQQQYRQPQQQYQQPQQQYQQPQQQYQKPQQQYQQPQQQYQQPQEQYQQPQQQYQQPQYQSRPVCEGLRQEQPAINRLIPVSAGHSPQYRPGPASPQAASQRSPGSQSRWAPVAPVSPQASPNYQQPQYSPQQQYSSPQQQYSSPQQQFSPPQQQYSSPQQQYSAPQQQYSPQPQYQPPQPQFEPPPSTVTLRPHPIIHQKPSPVFSSQPAAASFQGGVNMRGDMKWPPQSVKDAVAAENEARRQLAKGPACRPRKVKRDYSAFFAKNALGNTYPGYKVPPGTQHMGQTSF